MVFVLFMVVLGLQSAIPNLQTNIPRAIPAKVIGAETWRIEQVANDVEVDRARPRNTVKVGGCELVFAPNESFPNVDGLRVGSDGSVLVSRSSTETVWNFQDSIWFNGVETPLECGTVAFYRDRNNYSGQYLVPTAGLSATPPRAFVMAHGKNRDRVDGTVRYWGQDGLLVVEVPVTAQLKPSGVEFTEGVLTRLIQGEASWAFSGLAFSGRQKNGVVVLVAGGGKAQDPNGYAYMGKSEPTERSVLLWKSGRVLDRIALPKGWDLVRCSAEGWALLRKVKPLQDPFEGAEKMTHEQLMALMMKEVDTGEQDWTMGVLKGDIFAPVVFPRPKGTENLLWRSSNEELGLRSFRFSVFLGDEYRTYRLSH